MNKRYFITVDWCNKGKRGLFSDAKGNTFGKDEAPHTEDEMFDVLGIFDMILNPQSIEFDEESLKQYKTWIPLAEYSNQYGIALKV